jgi:hypothetical protein
MLGVTAGLTIAGALIATTPAQAKVNQSVVKYQPEPKGESKCENCMFFEPPSSCKNVEGEISPNGWCTMWMKKKA